MTTPVTRENCETANEFFHISLKNADGRTRYHCKRNGKTNVWKTRPNEFNIPVKRGMYEHGHINHVNAPVWTID